MKNKKLKLLEETILYYSENTLRRCRKDKTCFYDGSRNTEVESQGCAIGRILPKELAKQLDDEYTFGSKLSDVVDVYHLLPIEIQDYGVQFLSRLQQIHDANDYWDGNGLTEAGKIAVQRFKYDIEENLI